MKKTFKYIFSLIFMILLSLPLVACGETPPPDNGPGTNPPSGTLYGAWVDNSQSDIVTVSLSKTQAYAGETVTISYTIQPGYRVKWFEIMKSWQDEWGMWQNETVDTVLDSFVMPEHNVNIWVNIEEVVQDHIMTFEYDEPTDSYALTGWGKSFEQIVPSTYNDGVHGTKPVTTIRAEWRDGLDMVAVVRLPETITTIEEHMFSLPSYVVSVNIPSSVTNYYNREVTDPIDVGVMEVINHSDFRLESREGKVVTESNLYKTSDGKAYFIVDDNQTELVAVKAEENMAFPNRGVTLNNFDNPSKTTTLGNYDIYGYYCTDDRDVIKTITLGQGTIKVPELKYGPFLHEITLNQELKDFRDGLGLAKVETLTLPDSLEYCAGISYNNKIRNIVIGAGSKLKAITGDVCNNKHITLNEYQGAKYLPSASNDYFMLVSVNNHNTSELHIHPSCKVIASHAVWGEPNEVMTELTIPASVRGISEGFLSYAYALEKLTIAEGSCLEYFAHGYSENYNGVIFPASVTKLSGILPDFSYFQAKNVELDIQEDPYNQLKMFYDVDRLVENEDYSYVLTHADEAYLTYWNEDRSAGDLRTIDGYPIVYIEERVFENNTRVSGLKLSDKLRYIGRFAFSGCTGVELDELNCPELEFIGYHAFYGCERINVARIPKGCYVDHNALPAVVLAIEDTKSDFEELNVSIDFIWTEYKSYSYSTSFTREYYECKTGGEYYYGARYTTPSGETEPVKGYCLIKYLGNDIDIVPPSTIDGNSIGGVAPFCYSYKNIKTFDSLSVNIGLDSASLYVTAIESLKTTSFGTSIFTITLSGSNLYMPASNLEYVESNYFYTSNVASKVTPFIETIIVHIECGSLTGCKATNITIPELDNFLGELFRVKGQPDFPPLEDELKQSHHLNVPSTLKNLTITGGDAIGDYHLVNCSSLESVVLGSSIASIGENAFEGCSGLTSIELPGVVSVDRYAFYKCTGLKDVVFDYLLLTIDNDAFEGCNNIESVAYSLANPNATFEVDKLDAGVGGCPNFRYIYIVNTPNLDMSRLDTNYWNIIDNKTVSYTNMSRAKVAFIGSAPSGFEAEYNAQFSLETEIIYPNFYENITGIENNGVLEYMVYDTNKARIMKGLKDTVTTLNIAGLTVESISEGAFSGMNITNITMPNTIKKIYMQAFENCTSLTNITLSTGLEYIGWSAFNGCTNLGSITIPANVKTMHGYVFQNCTSLSSVNIHSVLFTTISRNAFSGCTALHSFHLPSQVKDIGDYAFYNTGITTFTGIENSALETIGSYAFVNATKNQQLYVNYWTSIPFTTLHFPDTLISVGERAFTNCNTLEEITFGSKVTSIGQEAFYAGIFTTLVLPNSVTHIGSSAFGDNEVLTSYIGPATETGTIQFIKTDSEYSSSLTHVELTAGSIIGEYCFTGLGKLESVIIGDSFWDFFYTGEYVGAVDDNLKFLSVPCFMGMMTDFNKTADSPFEGTLQVRGKAGFTSFPMGENSLYHKYKLSSTDFYSDYACLDLRECLFTEVGVSLGAEVTYVLMPTTLERITAEVTTGSVVLSNPLKEALPSGNEYEMSVHYMFGENVTIDDALWQAVNVVDITNYYVYNTTQYDYIKAQGASISTWMYYTDGMTKDESVWYWTAHVYGYPQYA